MRHRIGYSARVRLLFIIDPLDRLGLAGDTSYALMVEASRREHELWTCQIDHLGLEHDDPVAAAQLTLVREAETPREAFSVEARVPIPLDAFDMVLMRKDPPVDVNYLHATWILEQARGKTLLVNDPRGLRELNEHLAVLRFPELTPPTLVTRDARRLASFQREQGGAIVVKPVDGFGGLTGLRRVGLVHDHRVAPLGQRADLVEHERELLQRGDDDACLLTGQ